MLKLYLWTEVLKSYTDGVGFALASSEEEARRLLQETFGKHEHDLFEKNFSKPPRVIDKPFAFFIWGGD